MTTDRIRPLTAFALVALLCAVILAVGRAKGASVVLQTEVQPGVAPLAASTVQFGSTLSPVPGLPAGPLTRAVDQATLVAQVTPARRVVAVAAHRSAEPHAGHGRSRSTHATKPSTKQQPTKHTTGQPGRSGNSPGNSGWAHSNSHGYPPNRGNGSAYSAAAQGHAHPTGHSGGRGHGYGRGNGWGHSHGHGYSRGHGRGHGHGWGHRE